MYQIYTRFVGILFLYFLLPTIHFGQDCGDISVEGGMDRIEISGLTAPIEIVQVFDKDFNLIFRCEGGNCGDQQTIMDLDEGAYQVNVQFYDANWQFICQTPTQEVKVMAADTGGNGNCNDLQVNGGAGQIEIKGLTAPIEIVQVFDANYKVVFRCEGSDCGESLTVDNLTEGLYRVNAQFYDANWQFNCEKQATITTEGGGCQFDCSQRDILLSTQAEVDAFCGCTVIEGNLTIGNAQFIGTPTNITSLASLNELKEVKGDLKILELQAANLNGLSNLEQVGGIFSVNRISNLTDMQGLDKLNSVGSLIISSLFQLKNLNGLQQITVVENNLVISNNPLLNSIAQLSNLQTTSLNDLNLSSNTVLPSLNGLESITTIRNDFTLSRNNNLTELSPLRNIRFVGRDFRITENNNLSDCCSILHLVDEDPNNGRTRSSPILFSNAFPCRSTPEVIDACVNTCVGVYVTGGNGAINVFGLAAPKEVVRIFDAQGNEIYSCVEENCGDQQRVIQLAAGSYTVNVQFLDEAGQLLCESLNNTVEVLPFIADCIDVKVSATVGQITVENLNAPSAIVKVFDADFAPLFECIGQDCIFPTQTIDLTPDFYRVNVDLRDEDFNSICTRNNMTIQVPDNPCTAVDYDPLVAVYNSLNGGNWTRKWDLNDCDICNWDGITCNLDGRVKEINLMDNRLFGVLPPELVEFDQLELLDIRDNRGLLPSCFPASYQQFCGQPISILSNAVDLPFDGNFSEACRTGLGFTDADGDGVCETDDCDDFNPEIPASVGSRCDDGDPNTMFDRIQSDGCTCKGDDPNLSVDCETITFNASNAQLNIGNLVAPRVNISVSLVGNFSSIFGCNDCGENEVVLNNLQGGDYAIRVRYISFGNFSLCEKDTTLTIEGANCTHPDAAALVAIFDSLGGGQWINKWPVTDCNPCSWYGVTCDEQGRVTEIDLSNNRLNGNIPPKIGELTNLEQLILRGTSAGRGFGSSTTVIPPEIGNLRQLQVLDLSNSKGYSGLPKEIGQLTNLRELNMNRAYFWGGLPEEIGNLTNLEKLNLGYTYYEDFGETPSSFGNLANLKELNLTNSGIDKIPEGVYNLKKLEVLDVSINGIEETLSPRLFELTNLVELTLANNKFNGKITDGIGNLAQLKKLDVSANNFTGLPANIGRLVALESLNLSGNPIGSLPSEIGDLVNLGYLNARGTRLSGPIPANYGTIGTNAEVVNLDFSFNQLRGCFPAELSVWCADKYTVNFARNELEVGCLFPVFCETGGPIMDADNDGFLVTEDCDDTNPNVPNTPRTPCDDENPNTTDDLIQMDECTCLGIPNENVPPSCDLLQFFGDNAQLEIRGINTGNIHLKIFNGGFGAILFECFFNCEEQIIFPYPYTFFGGRPGLLNVEVQIYDTDESLLCSRREAVDIFPIESGNRNTTAITNPIRLFPNPAKDILTLETSKLVEQAGVIEIFDLLGNKVYAEKFQNGTAQKTINIQNLQNGLYWLSLKLENRKRMTRRFVIESWK